MPLGLGGEYVSPGELHAETIAARRAFIVAVRNVFPEFFERLRDTSPEYARLVGDNGDEKEAQALVLKWASQFGNAARQPGIISGALQTLCVWHRYPGSQEEVTLDGFLECLAGDWACSPDERFFENFQAGCLRLKTGGTHRVIVQRQQVVMTKDGQTLVVGEFQRPQSRRRQRGQVGKGKGRENAQ